ncbi:unnamed protein product (macronuclear) [Paramecium tetraurelia]|uniref:Sec23/Sec24 trunk domain-containing protein n=1 Tax=Paramecium tetraurelia TaxID=5888 RepID=A0BRR6_PARTE|nr:uncharacterized protein GSPATT00031464001 [Paramecium tetraurelia]CAK61233.1 unnamed protein product [Paramecium tetraurelia]|eukprot:XP_001428631.1 hypothetical protein (macronuclear) [Paramecium tetraurelia strain d4-2]
MGSGKAFLKEIQAGDNEMNINQLQEELDTNIFTVSFSSLGEKDRQNQVVHQGDPLYCQNCKGILNKFSNLSLFNNSGSCLQLSWNCEFCTHLNEIQIQDGDIPEKEEALYLIQSHFQQQSQKQEKNSITFCIDTSGSMSTTTEIKGKVSIKTGLTNKEQEMLKQFIQPGTEAHYLKKQKQISYVSRKQCLLSAIEQQIKKLQQQNPEKVVGLVTFNNEVVVYGDGSQQPIKFQEQELYQEVQIKTVLSRCANQMMQNPISKQADNIINICEQLQDNGQTALGPALISALELAKVGKPGSMIIICTDGLANLGIGALDSESSKRFYQELGKMAAEKGIIISLVTIKGEGCKIDTLGELVERTNGIVTRVNPEKIGEDFANIINDVVVGTQVELKVILHKALKFRREDLIKAENNTLKKYIGNVTKSTLQTFEYELKSEQELKKENIDIKKLKQIPFQIRITYTNLKGDRMMKVVTKLVQTTQNKVEAEKSAQVEVIHKRLAQKTAQIAKKGNYEEAQTYNQNWNQYLQKNPHINNNQINQQKNLIYQKHNEKLSTAIKNQEVRKQKSMCFSEIEQKGNSLKQNSEPFNSKEINNENSESILFGNSQSINTPLNKEKNSKRIDQNEYKQQKFDTPGSQSSSKIEFKKISSNTISTIDSNFINRKTNSSQDSSSSNQSDEDQDQATLYFYDKGQF